MDTAKTVLKKLKAYIKKQKTSKKLNLLRSPALAGGFFTTNATWEAQDLFILAVQHSMQDLSALTRDQTHAP